MAEAFFKLLSAKISSSGLEIGGLNNMSWTYRVGTFAKNRTLRFGLCRGLHHKVRRWITARRHHRVTTTIARIYSGFYRWSLFCVPCSRFSCIPIALFPIRRWIGWRTRVTPGILIVGPLVLVWQAWWVMMAYAQFWFEKARIPQFESDFIFQKILSNSQLERIGPKSAIPTPEILSTSLSQPFFNLSVDFVHFGLWMMLMRQGVGEVWNKGQKSLGYKHVQTICKINACLEHWVQE